MMEVGFAMASNVMSTGEWVTRGTKTLQQQACI